MRREENRSPEAVVREIRRKTRREFSPEERIRIVLEGMKGDETRQGPGTRPGKEEGRVVWCAHKRQSVVK